MSTTRTVRREELFFRACCGGSRNGRRSGRQTHAQGRGGAERKWNDKGKPVSCRVVVITVRSKSGFKGLVAPPPLKDVKTENHYLASDKKMLEEAFRKVEEGHILVVNAHANEDYFIYGKTKNPVYWTGDAKKNPGAWEFLGIKKPPKLAALVIASCMKASDEEAVSSARRGKSALRSTQESW